MLWFQEWERDWEFYIYIHAFETETGPYLVPEMRLGWESRRALVPGTSLHSSVQIEAAQQNGHLVGQTV